MSDSEKSEYEEYKSNKGTTTDLDSDGSEYSSGYSYSSTTERRYASEDGVELDDQTKVEEEYRYDMASVETGTNGVAGGGGGEEGGEQKWFHTWRLYAVVVGVLLFIGLILVAATVPNGYVYVEWHELALLRGTHPHNAGVRLDRVLTNGRYWTGTGFEKITFPRTLVSFSYRQGSPDGVILAFTSNGLEFSVETSFSVQLIPHRIPLLYSRFPNSYRSRIAALGLRALKNVAVGYSLTAYISNREDIHAAMYAALQSEIATLCGEVECVRIPSPSHFQLRRPIVPTQIRDTWLNAAIQVQTNIKQQNEQVRTLVLLETDLLRADITANITLVNRTGDAEASRIRTSAVAEGSRIEEEARAEAFRIREQSKGQGIQSVLSALNVTRDEDVREMLSLLTVMDSSDATVSDLYRRITVFDDPSTRVILGADNAVVSV